MIPRKKLWNPLGGRSNKEKKQIIDVSYTSKPAIITNGGQTSENGGKSEIPAKSSHQSRLSIFSSFSKGKAGIMADNTVLGGGSGCGSKGGGGSGGKKADPVLLGIRLRGEGEELQESLVQFNQNGVRDDSTNQSSRSLLRPRRLPTRSYSLTLQPHQVSKYPAKWTSTKELDKMASNSMVSDTPDGRAPSIPTVAGSETLPKIARQIQSSLNSSSAKKSRPTSKKKRVKKKSSETSSNIFFQKSSTLDSAGAVLLSRSTAAMANAEIERFEREFVKPMLQEVQKLKSTHDLNKSQNDETNIMSLPPMHINDTLSKSKMAANSKMADDQLTVTSSTADSCSTSSANTSTATEQTVEAAVKGGLAAAVDLESSPEQSARDGDSGTRRRRRRRERAPSSSTHSHVSDSNYDSGAFSRTSTPEITPSTPLSSTGTAATPSSGDEVDLSGHQSLPTNLPPLVSPRLVLALLRSGQANIVDGQLVLACLNAAGAESRFCLNSSQSMAAAVRGANASFNAGSFCLDKLDTTDGSLDLSTSHHLDNLQGQLNSLPAHLAGELNSLPAHLAGELNNLPANLQGLELDHHHLSSLPGLEELTERMTITTGMSSKENAVTISIGSTTKLQINEEAERNLENKFYSLSCLPQMNNNVSKYQSLTNFHLEQTQHREGGRSRLKAPHMGTARLGTPPKEGVATPPRSIERNKTALGTPKTQLKRQKTDKLKSSGSFKVNPNNNSKIDFSVNEDKLLKDDILWGRRAESTSSQDSSGVSSSASAADYNSGGTSCTCTSFVTVNGQHHCVIQYDESPPNDSSPPADYLKNPQSKTIKICGNESAADLENISNCDNNNTSAPIVFNL